MLIYPAIDIKEGKCVRLLQGRADQSTVYGDDPAEMARRWCALGAQALHVVDLDGAFTGEGKNLSAAAEIVKAADAYQTPVQLGGGIRSMDDIERRFSLGVSRVILGTAALNHPAMVREAAAKYPGRIVAGIDAKDGFVSVAGWTEDSGVTALALAKKLAGFGIRLCVFTDIAKDGMLAGPNIPAAARMIRESGMDMIVSGGVSSVADLLALKEIGAFGAITGKALYDGRIALDAALRAVG